MEQWSQTGRAQVPGDPPGPDDPPVSRQSPPPPPAAAPQPRQPVSAPQPWQPPTWQPPPLGSPPPHAASLPPYAASPPPYAAGPPPYAGGPPPYAGGGGPGPYGGGSGAPLAGPYLPVAPPRRRRSWPGVVALILVGALTAAVAVQSWQLAGLSARLGEANDQLAALAQDQTYSGERLDSLEDRATELERLAGEVFDSEAIASAVLPSVFKVDAGDFSGTAFAVGAAAESGGTNLLTNYHVIEQVWQRGDRQVALERTNQRYDAEIVEVEPGDDLAWLHTSQSFSGLVASQDEVRSGQPIIAVGAPLGLTDTVTTGVVSSPSQQLPDGTGPWIQFDAAINPGNSGGPVINSAQEVVGIATTKGRETEGLGFAVPIDVACDRFDVC